MHRSIPDTVYYAMLSVICTANRNKDEPFHVTIRILLFWTLLSLSPRRLESPGLVMTVSACPRDVESYDKSLNEAAVESTDLYRSHYHFFAAMIIATATRLRMTSLIIATTKEL